MKNKQTTRDAESRVNEILTKYTMDYVSPLFVPHALRREGYSYKWVRKDVRGQEDYRVEECVTEGWVPVPADRLEGFCPDPLDRNPLSKKFKTYKDLMLVERPSIFCDAERNGLHKMAHEAMENLESASHESPYGKPTINSF